MKKEAFALLWSTMHTLLQCLPKVLIDLVRPTQRLAAGVHGGSAAALVQPERHPTTSVTLEPTQTIARRITFPIIAPVTQL
jgi:hypothetical protein